MSASLTPPTRPTLAVVLPVLNEASALADCLVRLQSQGPWSEIIVVDGGSTDGSCELVRRCTAGNPVRLLRAGRGRARQMNAGAFHANADVLLFLHVDTRLPDAGAEHVRNAIKRGVTWGRFDVRLDGRHWLLRVVERSMTVRSALTGIATGDQAIFVRRDIFRMLGGYAPISLMEDIELSRRLKSIGRPARIRLPVLASARRWRRAGIVRTVLRMWMLRILYWAGVSPERLVRFYPDVR